MNERRARYFFAAFFFLFGLALRLHHISHDTPQPDEHHWVTRSEETLRRIQSADYGSFNAHLGHPGVMPSSFMTLALWGRSFWNSEGGSPIGNRQRLDGLTVCRWANALVSSLIFPSLFLGVAGLLGFETAFLSTLLLLLSPSHLAASRVAHLDSILTLLFTVVLVLYAHGERSARVGPKLLAGVFWGLAVGTKPTAAFLIPALLLYRLFRRFIARTGNPSPIFSWADIWAVVIGHAVFALSYSRLWYYRNRYVYKFKIHNPLTKYFDSASSVSHDSGALFLVSLAVVALSGLLLWRRRGVERGLSFHLSNAALVVGLFGAALARFPIVLSNFVRFWCWVAGLSSVSHESYGMAWQPAAHGYLGIIGTKLPGLILLGLLLACGSAILRFRSAAEPERERYSFLFLLVAATCSLCFFLSFSSKQTMRYALPIVPALNIIAGFGFAGVLPFFERFLKPFCALGCVGLLLHAVMSFQVLPLRPNFALFSNMFSGGIAAEIHEGRPFPVVGTQPAIDYLVRTGIQQENEQRLLVLGDLDILKYTLRRRTRDEEQRHLVEFFAYNDFASGDFLLVFPAFQSQVAQRLGAQFPDLQPVYKYYVSGVELTSLYKMPFLEYREPQTFDITKTGRYVGARQYWGAQNVEGVAVSQIGEPGNFLSFGLLFRLKPGRYELRFPVALLDQAAAVSNETDVVRLDFGPCSRGVRAAELSTQELRTLPVICDFAESSAPQMRIYAFGNARVFVSHPTLSRVP